MHIYATTNTVDGLARTRLAEHFDSHLEVPSRKGTDIWAVLLDRGWHATVSATEYSTMYTKQGVHIHVLFSCRPNKYQACGQHVTGTATARSPHTLVQAATPRASRPAQIGRTSCVPGGGRPTPAHAPRGQRAATVRKRTTAAPSGASVGRRRAAISTFWISQLFGHPARGGNRSCRPRARPPAEVRARLLEWRSGRASGVALGRRRLRLGGGKTARTAVFHLGAW